MYRLPNIIDPSQPTLGNPYSRGEREPNYFLPVIPLQVYVCYSFVAVCEMNDPQYKYGLVTLYPHN